MDKDVFANHVLNSVCLGFNVLVSLVQKEHFKNVTRCHDINVENDSTQDIFYPIFPLQTKPLLLAKLASGFPKHELMAGCPFSSIENAKTTIAGKKAMQKTVHLANL